jgi:hypothetical protein
MESRADGGGRPPRRRLSKTTAQEVSMSIVIQPQRPPASRPQMHLHPVRSPLARAPAARPVIAAVDGPGGHGRGDRLGARAGRAGRARPRSPRSLGGLGQAVLPAPSGASAAQGPRGSHGGSRTGERRLRRGADRDPRGASSASDRGARPQPRCPAGGRRPAAPMDKSERPSQRRRHRHPGAAGRLPDRAGTRLSWAGYGAGINFGGTASEDEPLVGGGRGSGSRSRPASRSRWTGAWSADAGVSGRA